MKTPLLVIALVVGVLLLPQPIIVVLQTGVNWIMGLILAALVLLALSRVGGAAKSAARLATSSRGKPTAGDGVTVVVNPYKKYAPGIEPWGPGNRERVERDALAKHTDRSADYQAVKVGEKCPNCGGGRTAFSPNQCTCIDVDDYGFVPQPGDVEIE